jgi:cytochrome c556
MKVRVLMLFVVLSSLACADRTHMRRDYGEATRSAMTRQVVNPDAGTSAAGKGLDPQEAAILARTLRRSMTPKDQTPASEPVFYVAPQAQRSRADDLPPPSVPNEGR